MLPIIASVNLARAVLETVVPMIRYMKDISLCGALRVRGTCFELFRPGHCGTVPADESSYSMEAFQLGAPHRTFHCA